MIFTVSSLDLYVIRVRSMLIQYQCSYHNHHFCSPFRFFILFIAFLNIFVAETYVVGMDWKVGGIFRNSPGSGDVASFQK